VNTLGKLFRPAELGRRAVLEPLVRQELGCGCAPEVFERIEVEAPPPGLPDGQLVGIGGRLLLLLVEDVAPAALVADLAALVARARELRDARGFNRFRLVLAVQDPAAGAALQQAFERLGLADPRLHLHLVSAAALRERLGPHDG
jgi:hypothetical protein